MLGFFKSNKLKRLKAAYVRKIEDARDLQRNGDIRGFASASAEAEKILAEIEAHEDRTEDD